MRKPGASPLVNVFVSALVAVASGVTRVEGPGRSEEPDGPRAAGTDRVIGLDRLAEDHPPR